MTLKTALAAAALTLLPAFAFAECSGYGHKTTATMSCADGMVFDADKGSCVVVGA